MGRMTAALVAVRALLRPRRSYRELEGLEDISRAFEAMTDIRETYGRLTRQLAELVGCDKCVISLYESETREFVCQWPGYNVADELLKKVRYPADALRPAWNFRHRGPMVNKRTEEFNAEQRAFLRPFGVYNLTEIPLVHEGRFIGKISIANKPGGLSENDVRLVTVFAAQVAVVIQNAHLYRRLQESAAQLEAKVHERTAELQATSTTFSPKVVMCAEVMSRLRSDSVLVSSNSKPGRSRPATSITVNCWERALSINTSGVTVKAPILSRRSRRLAIKAPRRCSPRSSFSMVSEMRRARRSSSSSCSNSRANRKVSSANPSRVVEMCAPEMFAPVAAQAPANSASSLG